MILLQEHGLTLVELPEGAQGVAINWVLNALYFSNEYGFQSAKSPVELPTGLPPGYRYTLIGTWPGLTEEQAREIVENGVCVYLTEDHFLNYTKKTYGYSALESFSSLLKSKQIDTTKHYAVIKAEKT